jgi:hypothetical protein
MSRARRSSTLISAGRIGAKFSDPLSDLNLTNLLTRQRVCRKGTQSFLVRTPSKVSDPTFVDVLRSVTPFDGGALLELSDAAGTTRITLRITKDSEGIRFDATATAPGPIWLVEWKLAGLELANVIIPALGGQALSDGMPAGTTLTYKYPFWWNAQFLIGEGEGGGVWFRTKDADSRFKLVRIKKSPAGFDLSYGFEASGPLGATTLSATWYLDCYRGSWKTPVDIHRGWMEPAFGLSGLDVHPSLPPWGAEINFILEIWGIGKESPKPLHTFEEMGRRLKAWAKLHPPRKTLLYLPGFAEHGIDSRAPSYDPSPELGGEEGFRKLVDLAHRLGYRVMIHTNVLCMTFDHPEFERFREHQVVDVFGRAQGWGLDIDGDWLAEPYFAYINPGVTAWGDLMTGIIGDVIRKFRVDGVFLDQTLLAFNVSRGPEFVSGMRKHIERLEREFPDTLFAGEGLHEQVLAPLAMAQIHGIDSIAEVHGMDGRTKWRSAHPVSAYLFGRYTRLTAHLLTRHPSHPMFKPQEAAYGKLGVLPALCLYNATQPMDTPEVRAMIRRANRL